MTVLAEIGYAGAAMLAKLNYPEPGAELSMLDAGDSLPGYDYPATRDLRIACAPLQILSSGKPAWQWASRVAFKNDLTSADATDHGQFYGYDGLDQVRSADVGQVNTGRIVRRLIGSVREAISQGAGQGLGMMNVGD